MGEKQTMTKEQTVRIAIGSEFLTAFSRLPKSQQKKARNFCDKFTRDPTGSGVNYEIIKGAADPNLRSVRIDQQYRAVLLKPESGDVYVMLWVDKHDDAYDWAQRHACSIHPRTGTLQVVPVAFSQPEPTAAEQPPETPALFATLSRDDLQSVGVPAGGLAAVTAVRTEQELDDLAPGLPEEAADALYGLAAGLTLEQVRNELWAKAQPVVDPADYRAALDTPGTQRQFVLVDGAIEMEKILSAPLEKWRVFLHPSQRRLKEMHANGPVRVLGGAGTGKTVVAMHRAQWLARHLCRGDERILFTTFTRNLAADIRANLAKICTHEELGRIEVINLDAWVSRFLRKRDYAYDIDYPGEKTEVHWGHALQVLGPEAAQFSPAFLRAEWTHVVQAQNVITMQEYFRASRRGRGRRLGRLARKQIWPLFEEYRALLQEHNLREAADAMRDARLLIAEEKTRLPYRSIVVDEGQDFGAEAFRLLRTMVPPDAAEEGDELFIVGDAHQRIYGHRIVLSQCGVDIRGRGRRLRINYRTPEEVRAWATAILEGHSFDDLDGGTDTTQGIRSLFHGHPPKLVSCSGYEDEIAAVVAHVSGLLGDEETPAESICLVAPTRTLLDAYQEGLQQAGFATHRLQAGTSDDPRTLGIRVATMHRVKGIEFDHVIVAGLSSSSLPLEVAPCAEPEDQERAEQHRCLLHVAATRARRTLLVTDLHKN